MTVEVRRYRKQGARWDTRFWGLYVDGELLAVTVYRKGALAVARMIRGPVPGIADAADRACAA